MEKERENRGEQPPVKKRAARRLKEALCGFCMALADSVPGVSGGTVAFMAGEYDRFIGSFHGLFEKDRAARRAARWFLLFLGCGWVFGMALSVSLLAGLFTRHIYPVSSLFLGLVAASVPLIAYEERQTLRQCRIWHVVPALLGGAAVVLLSLVHFQVSTEALSLPAALYILAGGALSISAMVLPGISGSTLLLAFGLYVPVLTGLKKCLTLDFSSLPLLVLFGTGVLAGIFLSFRGIRYLLRAHRTGTVCVVLGLAAGSLFAVVMGPTTLAQPLPPVGPETFSPLLFVAGAGVTAIFGVGKALMQKRRENHDGMDHAD